MKNDAASWQKRVKPFCDRLIKEKYGLTRGDLIYLCENGQLAFYIILEEVEAVEGYLDYLYSCEPDFKYGRDYIKLRNKQIISIKQMKCLMRGEPIEYFIDDLFCNTIEDVIHERGDKGTSIPVWILLEPKHFNESEVVVMDKDLNEIKRHNVTNVSIEQLASILDVSKNAVKSWTKKGLIPDKQVGDNKKILLLPESILKWMQQQAHKAEKNNENAALHKWNNRIEKFNKWLETNK